MTGTATRGTEPTALGPQLRYADPLAARHVGPACSSAPLAGAESGAAWADDPYAHAVRTGRGPLYLRRLTPGAPTAVELLPLDVERWCAAADAVDTDVLRRCGGPVLDVGCGPGRMVAALAARGIPALGVDVSPAAVARTRRLGGTALRRSVFERLPRERRWGTVLLMDGNVGIGGDPVMLLARLREVVRPGGRLLAEAAGDDVDERLTVRVEDAHGRHGRPFPWARVGVTALLHAASVTGWIVTGRWTADGRPFVELHRPNAGQDRYGRPHTEHPGAEGGSVARPEESSAFGTGEESVTGPEGTSAATSLPAGRRRP